MPDPVVSDQSAFIQQRTEAAARMLRGPVGGQYGGVPIGTNGHSPYNYHPAEPPQTLSETPWVSVVIPNYNRRDLLKHAIDSVLSQDYPKVECIVVDAGSKDGSIDLLKSYGDKITWVSRPDRGAFDAINDGWKMSKGEILAWVNSDDMWEPGAARFAAGYFRDHPEIDVLYGTCAGIDAEGRVFEDYPPRPWDLQAALLNCDHIINQTASFMRRGIIEKVDYLYPAWCHDHDLWLRIAVEGGTFGTTTLRLGRARIWGDNLGNDYKVIVPGKVGLTRRFFSMPNLPDRIRKLKRRSISNAYLRCLFYLNPARRRNWLPGAKLLMQAVAADPLNLPYLVAQVGGTLLSRTPVPGLARLTRRMVSAMTNVVLLPARASEAAFRLAARNLTAVVRILGPLAAVGVAAAVTASSDLGAEAAARSFFFLSAPLLALVWLYDRRCDN